jgi:hypothetical protein
MLTIITGQPLPNYIPVNEPSTRPEVLHCIHTPGKGGMDARLAALKEVIARTHPGIEIRGHPIESAYDPKAVHELGEQILTDYPADEWTLNATAGTKLMSSPLERLFHERRRRVIYVDTEQGRLVEVSADWGLRPQPFQRGVDVQTYFELFGQRLRLGEAQHWTEDVLMRQLKKLAFDDLAGSVSWVSSREGAGDAALAEFDAVATARYRLYVFERKHLTDPEGNPNIPQGAKRQLRGKFSRAIQHDLEKLAYTRAIFGGPFGRVFWLFSGTFKVAEEYVRRFEQLGVTVVPEEDVRNIACAAERLQLPPRRPTSQGQARRH